MKAPSDKELRSSQKVLPFQSEQHKLEFVIRFLVGGIVVSIFAILGDILRPKSFAGLFSAAPTIALVTLGMAFQNENPDYVSLQAQAMIFGSIALAIYGFLVCQLLMRRRWHAGLASSVALIAWFGMSAGLLTIWGP
jgi:uncharacterized membrane protein (GlpM family)